VVIEGRLVGLNDYVNAERTNRFKAAKIKKEMETLITVYLHNADLAGTLHKHTKPCELWITWVEPNKRRDLDNISFGTKFIQDAMVRYGVFPDDNQNYIRLLHHTTAFDKKCPRVEVIIREWKN
jgi:Holliday junction resolvase RusA-like endonuclease